MPSGSTRPRGVFDLPAKEARVAELNALIGVPGFWDDQRGAQRILREADGLQGELAVWRDLESRSDASFFQSWTWTGCLVEERFLRPGLIAREITKSHRSPANPVAM